MKFQTFLPIFSGFYNTIWEPDLSQYESDTGLKYHEDYDFDNAGYEKEVAADLCDKFADNFPILIKRIEFERVWSPKEYNFDTDRIYCTIHVNVGAVRGIIKAYPAEFDGYIRSHFTSYDGFMSHYSNEPEEWLAKMRRFRDLNSTEIGSILEFALLMSYREFMEDDTLENNDIELCLYYDVETCPDTYCTPKEKEEESADQ